ncbi:unnamed protein product [Brachionus calyciflorus]|uniref:Methyltransferase FkbM domain-containing protein n=1 Tax=Brachionus calyciflorus TaxID=104777 RepID=A0A814EHY7_9BILA|nr:unnamed protein product [Brachionus calyciflorus]
MANNLKYNYNLIFLFGLCIFLFVYFSSSTRDFKCSNLNEPEKVKQITEQNNLDKPNLFEADWKSIFEVSDEQKFIRPEILIKTAKFMIEERKEDDEELIAFVKTLIEPPSGKPINLTVKGKSDFSQHGQTAILERILNSSRNGFFVEAGGFDGEEMSNTVFLELERGWSGLLIEPVPNFYQQLIKKNRNIYTLNACIANNQPQIAKFKVNHGLSGRNKKLSDNQHKGIGEKFHYIYVPCFPFYTIMKALGRTQIDYFSVDLEGGEFDVISHIDYSKIDIKLFSIEWAWEESRKKQYIDYLSLHGYRLAEIGYVDVFMIK